MDIDINEFEKVLHNVLTGFREIGVTKFVLDKDYYWNLPAKQKYDVMNEPSTFTMGQCIEDWKEASKEPNDFASPQHLIWLGQVIVAVGELMCERTK